MKRSSVLTSWAALVLGMASTGAAHRARAQSLPPQEVHDVVFEVLPEAASEGILLGNGRMGVSLHGGSRIRLTLGRSDLWDLRAPPEFQTDEFSDATLARALADGDSETLRRVFEAPFEQQPWPTRLPAAELEVVLPARLAARTARLSLSRADATVELGDGATLELFVDAEREVGRLRIRGALPVEVLLHPAESPDEVPRERALGRLAYPPVELESQTWTQWMRQEIFGGRRFAAATRVIERANAWELVFTVTAPLERDPIAVANARLADVRTVDFDEQRRRHREWWRRYWSHSGLRFSERERDLEMLWYRSMYLLGCSARSGAPAPSTLGPWCFDLKALPQNKGVYDLLGELPWAVLAAIGTNQQESAKAVLEWLDGLRPEARTFTRRFYGNVGGWTLPGAVDVEGRPSGGLAAHAFCEHTSVLWACLLLEYADRIEDSRFAERVVLPWLEAALDFVAARSGAGDSARPRWSSDSLFADGIEAFVPEPSNAELAMRRRLALAGFEFAQRLGNSALAERCRGLGDALPQFATTAEAPRFLVAPAVDLLQSHRSHAHLSAFHPYQQSLPRDLPGADLLTTSLRHLDLRGAEAWVGTSFAWRAALAARARDPQTAVRALRTVQESFVQNNGLHAGGDLRARSSPFPRARSPGLDGNFAALDALCTMLVSTEEGAIQLFPGIPESWSDVQFHGRRVRGGFRVSARRVRGSVADVTVESERGGRCHLLVPFQRQPWLTDGDTADVLPYDAVDGGIAFDTRPGRRYVVREGL